MEIGIISNMLAKPCRDIMLCLEEQSFAMRNIQLRAFIGSNTSSVENMLEFAASGLGGIVICGIRLETVRKFLRRRPADLPVVMCTYRDLLPADRRLIGHGGTVMIDNEHIGRKAADYLLSHSLENFAFVSSQIFPSNISSVIRVNAFKARLREALGDKASCSVLTYGHVAPNGDIWRDRGDVFGQWIDNLPLPCGVFVNGDLETFTFMNACHSKSLKIPGQMEILCAGNSLLLRERANPAVSSLVPDNHAVAAEALKMVASLVKNPNLPKSKRDVCVSGCTLFERGSTMYGRDHGKLVSRAKEYIRANFCSDITVADVVKSVGVSRRTLEHYFRQSTGGTLRAMIQQMRLERVGQLLRTTDMSISEITEQAGYHLTTNLGTMFKKKYGKSMLEYRNEHRAQRAAKPRKR